MLAVLQEQLTSYKNQAGDFWKQIQVNRLVAARLAVQAKYRL